MSLQTYWLIIPLVGIGLSGFGWLALWLTRHREAATSAPATKREATPPV